MRDRRREFLGSTIYGIPGLTFYKDFDRIADGTYDIATYAASLLAADYSVGSGVPTITSTDGNFVIDGGYKATTANDDVLKYAILGNRTAAQETIVIKFTPSSDFVNDGVARILLDNGAGTEARRYLAKDFASAEIHWKPNNNDANKVQSTTTPLADVSYVIIGVCLTTGDPNGVLYVDGTSEGTPMTTDFTFASFGDYFFVGSRYSGTLQAKGTYHSIAFFNRPLSASEVATVTNLM